jgi:hypothetical protein
MWLFWLQERGQIVVDCVFFVVIRWFAEAMGRSAGSRIRDRAGSLGMTTRRATALWLVEHHRSHPSQKSRRIGSPERLWSVEMGRVGHPTNNNSTAAAKAKAAPPPSELKGKGNGRDQERD